MPLAPKGRSGSATGRSRDSDSTGPEPCSHSAKNVPDPLPSLLHRAETGSAADDRFDPQRVAGSTIGMATCGSLRLVLMDATSFVFQGDGASSTCSGATRSSAVGFFGAEAEKARD